MKIHGTRSDGAVLLLLGGGLGVLLRGAHSTKATDVGVLLNMGPWEPADNSLSERVLMAKGMDRARLVPLSSFALCAGDEKKEVEPMALGEADAAAEPDDDEDEDAEEEEEEAEGATADAEATEDESDDEDEEEDEDEEDEKVELARGHRYWDGANGVWAYDLEAKYPPGAGEATRRNIDEGGGGKSGAKGGSGGGKKLGKVSSIGDLRRKAESDPRYAKLAMVAAENLGGAPKDVNEAIRWLNINADEVGDEDGVVAEINGVRDVVAHDERKAAAKEPKVGKEPKGSSAGRAAAVESVFGGDAGRQRGVDAKAADINRMNRESDEEFSKGQNEYRKFDAYDPSGTVEWRKGDTSTPYSGQASKDRMRHDYESRIEHGWKPSKDTTHPIVISPNGKVQVRYTPSGKTQVKSHLEPAGYKPGGKPSGKK